MNSLAPIVLFAYNRPDHLKQTVDSLLRNKLAQESELYIFSDGPRNTDDEIKIKTIRNYIQQLKGFKKIEITNQKTNIGLANSIINGVGQIINSHQKAIVLEDDLMLSESFLDFMNNALDYYEFNDNIFSISGYCPPIKIHKNFQSDIFVIGRINSWGWATWKNRWNSVDWNISDFDSFIIDQKKRHEFEKCGNDLTIMLLKQMTGRIDSWAIRFTYACYKQNKLNIYPKKSLIQNKGADGSGNHVRKTKKYNSDLSIENIRLVENPQIEPKIQYRFKKFFNTSLLRKAINFWYLNRYLIRLKRRKKNRHS